MFIDGGWRKGDTYTALRRHGLEARAIAAKSHGLRRKASLAGLAEMAATQWYFARLNKYGLEARVTTAKMAVPQAWGARLNTYGSPCTLFG